jgi:ATP-binding protein involved in chromosome partitioning
MALPTKDQIIDVLRTVNDPELHRDIVSLKMVKNVAVCDGRVRVHVELTTPACPLKEPLQRDVTAAVKGLGGVKNVDVEFSAQVRQSPTRPTSLPGVKNIVAIGAGKGGVGKSTVAVLTAVGLARSGAKVGLLDADVYGPSIPKMMGVEDAKPAVTGDNNMIVPVEACGVKTISIGFIIPRDRAVIWRGPMVHGTIKQLLEQVDWGELDYLIVDLPPGTGDVPLTLSQSIPMTGAVVVCTPQAVALLDCVRAARMYQTLKVDVLGIIENMSYFIAPDTGKEYDLFGKGGAETAAQELGVPFLGSIPINIAVRVSGDRGTPADVFVDGRQGLGEAVMKTVQNLAGRISVRNLAQPAAPAFTIER